MVEQKQDQEQQIIEFDNPYLDDGVK